IRDRNVTGVQTCALPIWNDHDVDGDEFPGTDIIPRLYAIHIMIIPAAIIAMIGIHLVLLVLHKHTHYPGPGRTDRNVVGFPLFRSDERRVGKHEGLALSE